MDGAGRGEPAGKCLSVQAVQRVHFFCAKLSSLHLTSPSFILKRSSSPKDNNWYSCLVKSVTKRLDTNNNKMNNLHTMKPWFFGTLQQSDSARILFSDNYSIKNEDTLSINNWLPDVFWQPKYDLKTFLKGADLALESGAGRRKKQSPQSDESHEAFKA